MDNNKLIPGEKYQLKLLREGDQFEFGPEARMIYKTGITSDGHVECFWKPRDQEEAQWQPCGEFRTWFKVTYLRSSN